MGELHGRGASEARVTTQSVVTRRGRRNLQENDSSASAPFRMAKPTRTNLFPAMQRMPATFYRRRSGLWSRQSLGGANRRARHHGRRRVTAYRGSARRTAASRRTALPARSGAAGFASRHAGWIGTGPLAVEQRTGLATGHRSRQDQYRGQGKKLTHDSFPPNQFPITSGLFIAYVAVRRNRSAAAAVCFGFGRSEQNMETLHQDR